jgi:radical SAM superfamily enzyme YgiQ (UPF0313 family)
MSADLTLVNMNMLLMRYRGAVDFELHTPLGCLYLVKALEGAGLEVDFRDYQLWPQTRDPFAVDVCCDFLRDPAPIIGLSCMANLLPFTVLAARELRRRHPDRKIVLGGVGPKGVEDQLLRAFPWIDAIARGEGDVTGPELVHALRAGRSLRGVLGVSFREGADVVHTPDRPRIEDLDAIGWPSYDRIDVRSYPTHGVITSRGCPYPCTFCSVMPVWAQQTRTRSARSVVAEMALLNERHGVDLFLFQDEFFLASKERVLDFCAELQRVGLRVRWKAFGRVNLVDEELMAQMARAGCVQLRFGIESGCDEVLGRIKKGFTAAQSVEAVSTATRVFPSVETFYIWGFPFESMSQFRESLFQMIAFRLMGAHISPSLLCWLPQTELYAEHGRHSRLEFRPELVPELVLTGHETILGDGLSRPRPAQREVYELIRAHPEIFPGFLHHDAEGNVLPKLAELRKHGFYGAAA